MTANREIPIERHLVALENAIKEARTLAKKSPGRYGGRYVACLRNWFDSSQVVEFTVLDHDDPERLTDDDDVFVHVQPDIAGGMGRCRYYIKADGTVDREYFKDF